ncbi:MAG: hypothetical protein ABI783_05370, partial [Actinomycetota bacterium]
MPGSPLTTRIPPPPARRESSAARPGRELSVAADELRLRADQPALAARAGMEAAYRPCLDGVSLPLQLERTLVPPVEENLDGPVCGVVDEDGARLGGSLQARSEVHGVTERGVLDSLSRTDLADHDRPGCRADADAETLDAPTATDVAPVLLHLADDPQGNANRTLGVVLPRRRRTEEGEYPVAREVLDVTAERLD